jgi:hypothetical protein
MFGLGGGEFLLFFIFLLLPVLVIWTLIDILKSEFSGNNKIVWILVVMFLPFLGSLLYLGIGRNQKI